MVESGRIGTGGACGARDRRIARHRPGDRRGARARRRRAWPSRFASVKRRRARWSARLRDEGCRVLARARATSATRTTCRRSPRSPPPSSDRSTSWSTTPGITRDGFLLMMDRRKWESVLRVNLDGAYYCIRAVLRGMLLRGVGAHHQHHVAVGDVGSAGAGQLRRVEGRPGRSDEGGGARAGGEERARQRRVARAHRDRHARPRCPLPAREGLLEGRRARPSRHGRRRSPPSCVFLASPAASYITGQVIASMEA